MRRQSRVSREIVSSHQGLHPLSCPLFINSQVALDHGLSVVPTKEWQENLSKRLAFGSSSNTCPSDDAIMPVTQKRRLNNTNDKRSNWDSLYTIDPTPGTNLRS